MSRIRLVSRVPFVDPLLPAPAIQAETPKERYKTCEDEQTSLIGKAACYRTLVQEKLTGK